MKILSKFKDFYDYLTGIYGEDPKIVLDRRDFSYIDLFSPEKVVFYICGKKIEGFFDGEKCYYGESLLKFGKRIEISKQPSWVNRFFDLRERHDYCDYVTIDLKEHKEYGTFLPNKSIINVNIEIVEDKDINKKEDCPILMKGNTKYAKFPPLINYNISSILPPEEIYQMLVEWYSNKNNELENRPDNRTDVEKLTSKGFDKKCSFRNI